MLANTALRGGLTCCRRYRGMSMAEAERSMHRLVSAAALIEGELGARMPALLGRAGDLPGTLSPERSPR